MPNKEGDDFEKEAFENKSKTLSVGSNKETKKGLNVFGDRLFPDPRVEKRKKEMVEKEVSTLYLETDRDSMKNTLGAEEIEETTSFNRKLSLSKEMDETKYERRIPSLPGAFSVKGPDSTKNIFGAEEMEETTSFNRKSSLSKNEKRKFSMHGAERRRSSNLPGAFSVIGPDSKKNAFDAEEIPETTIFGNEKRKFSTLSSAEGRKRSLPGIVSVTGPGSSKSAFSAEEMPETTISDRRQDKGSERRTTPGRVSVTTSKSREKTSVGVKTSYCDINQEERARFVRDEKVNNDTTTSEKVKRKRFNNVVKRKKERRKKDMADKDISPLYSEPGRKRERRKKETVDREFSNLKNFCMEQEITGSTIESESINNEESDFYGPGAYAVTAIASGERPFWTQQSSFQSISSLPRYDNEQFSTIGNFHEPFDSEMMIENTNNDSIYDEESRVNNDEGTQKQEDRWGMKLLILTTLIIIVCAVILSILVTRRRTSSTSNHSESFVCDLDGIEKDFQEISRLPLTWRKCFCKNDIKADIPENYLITYDSLKHDFVQNFNLTFENDENSCDSRTLALHWLAKDKIESDKILDKRSTINRFVLALSFLSMSDNYLSPWRNDTGWLTSDSECRWIGIECDVNEKEVLHISLSNNKLLGNIPKEISYLSKLNSIQLTDNSISGTIPSEIGLLRDLSKLKIEKNKISGHIPKEIAMLTRLDSLYLGENVISGTIMTEFGLLSNIRFLRLNENRLQGTIPIEIGNLNSLDEIYLEHNDLMGTIPQRIWELRSLKTISLGSNILSGSLPSTIGLCTSLENINLLNNMISGALPSELGNLHKLQLLYLRGNQFSSIPSTIGLCTALSELNVESNKISGTIPSEIGNLSLLRTLDLRDNLLSGTIPTHLSNCQELGDFQLALNAEIEGRIPSELGKLSNLQKLSLCRTALTGDMPSEICDLRNTNLISLNFDGQQICNCCSDRCGEYNFDSWGGTIVPLPSDRFTQP